MCSIPRTTAWSMSAHMRSRAVRMVRGRSNTSTIPDLTERMGLIGRMVAEAPALDEIPHCANEKVEMCAWLHPVQRLDNIVDTGSARNKLDGLHDHEPESKT